MTYSPRTKFSDHNERDSQPRLHDSEGYVAKHLSRLDFISHAGPNTGSGIYGAVDARAYRRC